MTVQKKGVFLGVDGGGTKTAMQLVTANGELLASSISQGTNLYTETINAANQHLSEQLQALRLQAGVPDGVLNGAFFGLAGLFDRADKAFTESLTLGMELGDSVQVDSDAYLAWFSGTAGEAGIVVISGTGSIVYGVDAKGGRQFLGGLGPLLGDQGSGYWMGLAAIKLALQSIDCGKQSLLADALQKTFAIENSLQALDVIKDRDQIAGFTQQLYACAKQGCTEASAIVDLAAGELAELVIQLAKKMQLGREFSLAYHGGCLLHMDMLRERLFEQLQAAGLTVTARCSTSSVAAAATLAIRNSDKTLSYA